MEIQRILQAYDEQDYKKKNAQVGMLNKHKGIATPGGPGAGDKAAMNTTVTSQADEF
jgi:hypothetical protein